MKLFVISLLFLSTLYFECNAVVLDETPNKNKGKKHQIPIIEKNKTFPGKYITKEDASDERYILLETTSDILLDKDARLAYVSEKKILIYNYGRGDIFIFDAAGKTLSRFNHKNKDGIGYAGINFIAFDEQNKEIFIADYLKRILVYTEDGKLKRTLYFPPGTWIEKFYIFDEHTLFAVHENRYGKVDQKQPYLFLSRKDGSIVSRLPITFNKVLPDALYTYDGDKITNKTSISSSGDNYKFGDEFIIADRSLDTIYLLNRDKTLTPLFIQSPSVFDVPCKIITVGLKTNHYITFSVVPWDFSNKQGGKIAVLMYDFRTGVFCELKGFSFSVKNIDVPKGCFAQLIESDNLITALKQGRLKGKKVEKVASLLQEEDNPVVRIVKYK